MVAMERPIIEILREVRLMRGRSHREMAAMLGIHRPSYGHIEAAKRRLTAEELRKCAKYLEVPITVMYGIEAVPTSNPQHVAA
jgi:transcriptional regulator with XRE-family HTH domain